MYLPKPWKLNPDVMESEYTIFEYTAQEHDIKLRIGTGLIALLYEQLLLLEGNTLFEVYPVQDNERAQRFLILFYASSAFLYSSALFDLAARGRYLESEALMRPLLETVAFAEYFHLNKDRCLSFFDSGKGIPDQKKVYRFLKVHGHFPQGGPEKVIARFHASAHANIHARMKSWVMKDESGKIIGFHTHKFDSDSFVRIAHHIIMPLVGIQQLLYEAFDERMSQSLELAAKWQLARPMDLIIKEFPDLWFNTKLKEYRAGDT
jgi:hypothetical protein